MYENQGITGKKSLKAFVESGTYKVMTSRVYFRMETWECVNKWLEFKLQT